MREAGVESNTNDAAEIPAGGRWVRQLSREWLYSGPWDVGVAL